jgi:hypothetical protein
VIKTVAAREEVDKSNLTPHDEIIEPEARNTACRTNSACVTFEYHGYVGAITGDN